MLMTASAASLRTALPPGGRVRATHGDRKTRIMAGMDHSHGRPIPVPELIAEIEASRVNAALEGACA
jgi:hypothetical protein